MRQAARTVKAAPDTGADALVARLDAPGAGGVELRIGILLWPQFPLLSLAGLCDALRHAADIGDQSQQLRCSWTVLGTPGERIAASCGIEVPVQQSLGSEATFDYIAVIGGLLPQLDKADRRQVRFLKQAAASGVPLLGICTGSFVLAHHGLMDGHTACVHPFHVADWQRLFPALPHSTHGDYLIDGDRITCAGGVSIIELATELVRRHCGADRAAKVVHQMTVSRRAASSHVARRHALGYAGAENDKLRQAILLMEKNIATPLEIGVIARLVECNRRQLERVFVAETGLSPAEFYRRSRLKFGRWLLTTTDAAISVIAADSGFADSAHFIRLFQQHYGMAPGRLRAALVAKV